MTEPRDVDRDEKQGRFIRFTKLAVLALAILVLLVLASRLVGLGGEGGEHGPSRHGSADPGGQTIERHTPPPGMHE